MMNFDYFMEKNVRIAKLQSNFRSIYTNSGFLIGVSTLVIAVLQLTNSIVLTRILDPGVYGLVSIITSVFYIAAMVTDLGFQAYLVRHARADERHFVDVVWTIHAIRGLFLTIITLLLSHSIAQGFQKQDLTPLLAVASIIFVINGLSSLQLILAVRHREIAKLAIFDISIMAFQVLFGIILSIIFRNAWAIVITMILSSAFRTLCSYRIAWKANRKITFDKEISSDLWKFSRPIALSSIITLLIVQSDKIVFARIFTLEEFGIYAIAVSLAQVPTAIAYNYCSRVLYPLFSDAWRNEDLNSRKYYDSLGWLYHAYLFSVGGMVGGAWLLVAALYDPRYVSAAFYLSILAIGTVMALPTRSMSELMNAMGRPEGHLRMNFCRLGWLAIAGSAAFMIWGSSGLVFAVGLLEVPPYCYAVMTLKRMKIVSIVREFKMWGLVLCGVFLGFAISETAIMLTGGKL